MKRILVGLDGSKRAPLVMGAAAQLAKLTGAKLIAYRAISIPTDMPQELLTMIDRRLEDVLISNARTGLERLAIEAGAREQVEQFVVTLATAWDGICRTATEYNVDLVVIGSHGYGGLDRVLGTTASKVVNHTDRNLFVVRQPV